MVNDFDDCVLSGDQYSTLWSITEPQIKCDVVTLDNQLDNEYTDHLMQGKSLTISQTVLPSPSVVPSLV